MLPESLTDAVSIITKHIQVLRIKSYEQMHTWAQLDILFQIKSKLMETTTFKSVSNVNTNQNNITLSQKVNLKLNHHYQLSSNPITHNIIT